MKPEINDVNTIFNKVNKELSPKFKGKIIAIDAKSGDYFIGDSEIDAYKKAVKKHPNKKFVFKRIGFTTHFVRAIFH